MLNPMYLFIDEGGNFDFSCSGTKFFTVTSVSNIPLLDISPELTNLKYNLIKNCLDIECFHASEDNQIVRNQVFGIIKEYTNKIRIDSIVIEKRKTYPHWQKAEIFYPEMMRCLLKYVLRAYKDLYSQFVIITDRVPTKSIRKGLEKSIKKTLSNKLSFNVEYKILHHESKSNFGLQIVDYCNWAIYRKWDNEDERSYNLIKEGIYSEFDIFKKGQYYFY